MALIFPAIIIRLWGCTPLPPGESRQQIESFCRKQNLAYAEILTWPLFEGRMLTAGVMGLTRKFRYLLITPGLLKAMNQDEIDAVLAHEIGHVKRHHLQALHPLLCRLPHLCPVKHLPNPLPAAQLQYFLYHYPLQRSVSQRRPDLRLGGTDAALDAGILSLHLRLLHAQL